MATLQTVCCTFAPGQYEITIFIYLFIYLFIYSYNETLQFSDLICYPPLILISIQLMFYPKLAFIQHFLFMKVLYIFKLTGSFIVTKQNGRLLVTFHHMHTSEIKRTPRFEPALSCLPHQNVYYSSI